jgi:chaperone required for assembly of F1-ATPase
VREDVARYLGSDMLCYRAEQPERLVQRQTGTWDPLLAWARETLGARFVLAAGVTFVAQPAGAVEAAAQAIPSDPWRVGAVHTMTTLTGSALLALAVLHGRMSAEQAWQAAHLDEDWNMELWGRDEIALARRAARFAEMQAAATVVALLSAERSR